MQQPRIVLIEPDEPLRVSIEAALEAAGFSVITAGSVLEGLRKVHESCPDLAIMAKELPLVNGEEPVLYFRHASYLPMLVLGGDEEATEVLELGADAYITKPPSLSVLVARVRALLRRKPRDGPPGGNRKLEIENRLPNGGNGSNGLTRTEFRLASCLILNKGALLDYRRLISEVWGGKEVSLDTLHFYIRRLRSKLANVDIFGLRGVGYCLSADGSQAP